MIADFLKGAKCIFSGCKAFYNDRKAWKYAVFPLGIMFALYCLVFWRIISLSGKMADIINEKLSGLPEWLSFLHSVISGLSSILGIVVALFILGSTVCIFYEMFGSFFFDPLVEYYEQKKYGISPRKLSFGETFKYGAESFVFGIRLALYFSGIFLVGLFLPVAGQLLFVVLTGYFMGISYMICPAINSNVSIKQLRKTANKKWTATLGFGLCAYLLLLIPFSTLILLPGLVLGGSDLYNSLLKEEVL